MQLNNICLNSGQPRYFNIPSRWIILKLRLIKKYLPRNKIEWHLPTRAQNVTDILSNTPEDMKQRQRPQPGDKVWCTLLPSLRCTLPVSPAPYVTNLLTPDNRCHQEGAARQERVRSGKRMSPRDFHTENVTLYFLHSLRNSGCNIGISGDPGCPGAVWPHIMVTSVLAARGHHHQGDTGFIWGHGIMAAGANTQDMTPTGRNFGMSG